MQVQDHKDGSLAFRRSCRHAICGSCGMRINGCARLACNTQLAVVADEARRRAAQAGAAPATQAGAGGPDAAPAPIRIEPLGNMPVIKDLITDMTEFWEKLRGVQPWLQSLDAQPDPDHERLMSPAGYAVISAGPSLRGMWLLLLGLLLGGGERGLRRPHRARQGLPLRLRLARRPDAPAPVRPLGRARPLGVHPLLLLHPALPEAPARAGAHRAARRARLRRGSAHGRGRQAGGRGPHLRADDRPPGPDPHDPGRPRGRCTRSPACPWPPVPP